VPADWAMTQMILGNTPETLGERESGTAHLEEAVAAYDDALSMFIEAEQIVTSPFAANTGTRRAQF
jgi:hypothetical protein